jgi:hypothetical protein
MTPRRSQVHQGRSGRAPSDNGRLTTINTMTLKDHDAKGAPAPPGDLVSSPKQEHPLYRTTLKLPSI